MGTRCPNCQGLSDVRDGLCLQCRADPKTMAAYDHRIKAQNNDAEQSTMHTHACRFCGDSYDCDCEEPDRDDPDCGGCQGPRK